TWRGPYASALDADHAADAANAADFAAHRAADPYCTCNDCIGHHAEQTPDAPTTGRIVCPKCGARIDASVTLDCDVNDVTGVITGSATGGGVLLYCAVDCGWRMEGPDMGTEIEWPDPIRAEHLTGEPS